MVIHFDEVEPASSTGRSCAGRAGAWGPRPARIGRGLSRYRIAPGERAMPVHVHADEEELFYVLDGEGAQLAGRARLRACAPATASCTARRRGRTRSLGAGDGLDVLAFSGGSDTGLTWLPRARAWWNGPHWLPHDGAQPVRPPRRRPARSSVPEPEPERPPTIVALDARRRPRTSPAAATSVAVRRDLGDALGSQAHRPRAPRRSAPGALSGPPHCHAGRGGGLRRPRRRPGRCCSATRSTRCARAAWSPARPAPVSRTPSAPATTASRSSATGTREPGDIRYYPRSRTLAIPGLRASFSVEQVDVWDLEA